MLYLKDKFKLSNIDMMYEVRNVQHHEGESKRRWFFDPEIDLTIWVDDEDRILGFQLSYDRPLSPHALTWIEGKGFFHNSVDDGENPGTFARKGVPILLPDGEFDIDRVSKTFKEQSKDIDAEIAQFVYQKIRSYS